MTTTTKPASRGKLKTAAKKLAGKAAASRKRKSPQRPRKRAQKLPVIETAPYEPGRLVPLGVYGFKEQELAILTALVTRDPMLLIGRSGTGKTFLLNSLSEALGLEHRHYNASLISFDDLVGFPYPDENKSTIRFLETPATVWGAESVLVDEISRCKPEHQNRLFSLVHERRVQGIALEKLRYRWAAMNPCSGDQGDITEDYMGSQPLDPALADRFAVIIEVGDWGSLSAIDRKRIADPAGEGALSNDGGALAGDLQLWRRRFENDAGHLVPFTVDYVCNVVTALGDGGIRVSPRRARMITRTLLAAWCITGRLDYAETLELLDCSLPHKAWGEAPEKAKIVAAHRMGWDALSLDGDGKWIHDFHVEKDLGKKAAILMKDCPGEDAGTLVIEQLLANETPERAAAFAFAAFPAAVAGRLPVGAESVNDLGRIAENLLTVEGEISWSERLASPGTGHPEFERIAPVLEGLKGARKQRATQYFHWCLLNEIVLEDPIEAEDQLHRCTREFGKGRVK